MLLIIIPFGLYTSCGDNSLGIRFRCRFLDRAVPNGCELVPCVSVATSSRKRPVFVSKSNIVGDRAGRCILSLALVYTYIVLCTAGGGQSRGKNKKKYTGSPTRDILPHLRGVRRKNLTHPHTTKRNTSKAQCVTPLRMATIVEGIAVIRFFFF